MARENFAVDYNSGRDALCRHPETTKDDLTSIMAPRVATRVIGSWVHYMLFGYERVGEASGLTRFGTHKWFDEGAQFLMDIQNPDGSWSWFFRVK